MEGGILFRRKSCLKGLNGQETFHGQLYLPKDAVNQAWRTCGCANAFNNMLVVSESLLKLLHAGGGDDTGRLPAVNYPAAQCSSWREASVGN